MNSIEEHFEIAENKLHSAQVLLENDIFDDSISRSYYAMFNAAKALLLTEDSSPKTHVGVNSELGKLFRDRIEPSLLRKLTEIQGLREKADYTNYRPEKEEAEDILDTGEKFVEEASNLVE